MKHIIFEPMENKVNVPRDELPQLMAEIRSFERDQADIVADCAFAMSKGVSNSQIDYLLDSADEVYN